MRRYDAELDLARDHVRMVEQGAIAQNLPARLGAGRRKQHIRRARIYLSAQQPPGGCAILAEYRSDGWSSRLFQPLTHPHVLSLNWRQGAVWGEADEQQLERRTLRQLALALTRRCRQRVYLGYSELGESGYEARGLLLETLQTAQWRLQTASQSSDFAANEAL